MPSRAGVRRPQAGLQQRQPRQACCIEVITRIIRHDNLKAAVVRACLYDPDVNPVYAAFGAHWGFTPLPTRPRNPQENGKQERSGGYVKTNALAGHRFNSLDEQNQHLRRWNRTIARLRIHGTTRRQVFTHFEETDKKVLQPLAAAPFAIFEDFGMKKQRLRNGREDAHA